MENIISQELLQQNIHKVLRNILGAEKIDLINLEYLVNEYQRFVDLNYSPSYSRSVRLSLSHLTKYFDNHKLLSSIDLKQMEFFFDKLREHAPKGYRVYYRNIKAAFNKAVDWGYVSENPLRKLRLPKEVRQRPKFITKEELTIIENAIKDQTVKDFVVFAFYTGMRLSEIINLKWLSVNLAQGIITIGDEFFRTKTGKQRTIPLPQIAQEILVKRFPKIITINKSYVFQKTQGVPLNADYVSKIFKRSIREVKMDEQLHFHSLRHSYASNLALSGVSLHEIRDLLGHSSIQTTEIYSHLTLDKLRDAVSKLNSSQEGG